MIPPSAYLSGDGLHRPRVLPSEPDPGSEEEFLASKGYGGLNEARSQVFRRASTLRQEPNPFRPQRGSR